MTVGSSTDRVLLLGMMGAGKTTVGRALGAMLGWPYYDNDELLQRAVGIDTRMVQEQRGEAVLRRAESMALTVALSEAGPLIAGVAAGVIMNPLDRDRIHSGGFVVWLRANIETLARRVRDTDRPWLRADPAHALKALYAGRAHLYASVADLVVDVDELPPDVIANRIVTELATCQAVPSS